MKSIALILACSMLAILSAGAQSRIFRSEFVPFETREQARALNREASERYLPVYPDTVVVIGSVNVIKSKLQVPRSWTDSDIFLHLENIGAAYMLMINGEVAATVEDSHTPADFLITPYVSEGHNEIALALRPSRVPQIQQDVPASPRQSLENSYVFSQRKVGIRDFEVELRPDSLRRFGVLDLRVVVGNSYNFDEPLTIGYDIYSPAGKLMEYSVKEVSVPGRSTDTVRFTPYIYHTNENKWGDGKAPLYALTLYIKVGGILREYIPMQIGFGKTEFADGRIVRFDRPLDIRSTRYNAAKDRLTARKEITALKAKGFNTLRPDYPQPWWFYALCDQMGVYVIDRANINAPDSRDDRAVGGTPSNDPSLVGEYLERVKGMYYRSRNHSCIIAYELGGPSGNGYCMYKAYQWLKSVEKSRPVIYSDADGEWNSDEINLK